MSAHAPARYALVGGANAVLPADRQLTIDTTTPARTRTGVAGDDGFDDGYESPDAVNSDTSSSSTNSTTGPAGGVGDSVDATAALAAGNIGNKEEKESVTSNGPPRVPPPPLVPSQRSRIINDHQTFNVRTYSPPLARRDHVVVGGAKRLDNAAGTTGVSGKSSSRQPRYVTVMGLADADDVSTTAFVDDMAPVTDLDAVTLDALLTRDTPPASSASSSSDKVNSRTGEKVGRDTGKPQKKETSIDDGEDEDADVTSTVNELEAFDYVSTATKQSNGADVEAAASMLAAVSSIADDCPPVIISSEPPANLRTALKSRDGNKPMAKKTAVSFDQRVQVVYQDVLDEHVRQKYTLDINQAVLPPPSDTSADGHINGDTAAMATPGDATDQPTKLGSFVLPRVSMSSGGSGGRSAASILGVQRVKPPTSNPAVSIITLAPPQHNGFLGADTDGSDDAATAGDASKQAQQQVSGGDNRISSGQPPPPAINNSNVRPAPTKLRRTVANTDTEMVKAALDDAVAAYDNEPRSGSNSRSVSRPSTDNFLPPSRTDGAAALAAGATANSRSDAGADKRLAQTSTTTPTVTLPPKKAVIVTNNGLDRADLSSASPSLAGVNLPPDSSRGKSSSLPYKTLPPALNDAQYGGTAAAKSASLPPNASLINADKHFAPYATSAARHDHWQRQFDAASNNGNVVNNTLQQAPVAAWPDQPDRRLVTARDSPTMGNSYNNTNYNQYNNGRVPVMLQQPQGVNGQQYYVTPAHQMQNVSTNGARSRSVGNLSSNNSSWNNYPAQQPSWTDEASSDRSLSFSSGYPQPAYNGVTRYAPPPGDSGDNGYINSGQTNDVMLRLGVVKRGDKWRSSLTREAGNQMREQRREAARLADASSFDSSSLPMSLPGSSQAQRNDVIRQSQRPAANDNVKKVERHKAAAAATPPSSSLQQQQSAPPMRLTRMPDEILKPNLQQQQPPPSQTPSGTRLARMPDEILRGVAPYSSNASYTPAFMPAGNFVTPPKAAAAAAPPPPANERSSRSRQRQLSFGDEASSLAPRGSAERASSAGHGAGGRSRRRSNSEVGRQSSFASTTHIMKVMQARQRNATLDNTR